MAILAALLSTRHCHTNVIVWYKNGHTIQMLSFSTRFVQLPIILGISIFKSDRYANKSKKLFTYYSSSLQTARSTSHQAEHHGFILLHRTGCCFLGRTATCGHQARSSLCLYFRCHRRVLHRLGMENGVANHGKCHGSSSSWSQPTEIGLSLMVRQVLCHHGHGMWSTNPASKTNQWY
jgi:hypothetical protein